MSVRGEFVRVASDCIEIASAHATFDGGGWCARLERALEQASDDLAAAARSVIEAHDVARLAAPRFPHTAQGDAFAERLDHLLAICRVITGA